MSGKQHLCKWEKTRLPDELDLLKKIVAKPRYVCTKCGRAARKKGYLCEPDAL